MNCNIYYKKLTFKKLLKKMKNNKIDIFLFIKSHYQKCIG